MGVKLAAGLIPASVLGSRNQRKKSIYACVYSLFRAKLFGPAGPKGPVNPKGPLHFRLSCEKMPSVFCLSSRNPEALCRHDETTPSIFGSAGFNGYIFYRPS